MRLDKYLANKGLGSRKEVKKYIEEENVYINGLLVTKANKEINPEKDKLVLKNKDKISKDYLYLMMNKPSGFICQTKSLSKKTVIDLLPKDLQKKDLSPAGRLDLDTEGLVILTNDGLFLQKIISPSSTIYKKYYARVDKAMEEADIKKFEEGIYIKEENYKCLAAKLEIISPKECYVYIREGKYHQVKRMLKACGKKVLYLKRLAIGKVYLDKNLKSGSYRKLSDEEIYLLKKDFD
ncbi:MAG: pseudouridine synthase [Peptoniphilaceae bacterium]|nr:pseudouridine synthase [Peptoniphilaceae bacterium]MDY6019510.1 pseudouridine synthase [Anaerococcus sp.]